jgi:hypothetical protein
MVIYFLFLVTARGSETACPNSLACRADSPSVLLHKYLMDVLDDFQHSKAPVFDHYTVRANKKIRAVWNLIGCIRRHC